MKDRDKTREHRLGGHWEIRTAHQLYGALGILSLVIVSTVMYSVSVGVTVETVYMPQVYASMETKVEAVLAHLWLEESLASDWPDMTVAWEHMDRSQWYARAMLQGGRSDEGTFVALGDPEHRREVGQLIEALALFREIAQARVVSGSRDAGIGSDMDQRFDAVFEDFLAQATEVESHLRQHMRAELGRFKITQGVLIGACVGSALLVAVLLRRLRRREALALKELERSNADLEQFAYVASHDLQEPLRMVVSYTQLLAEQYHGKLDADADDFIDFACSGARRMQQLIQDLLEYSRVGKCETAYEATDTGAVVGEVLDALCVTIAESGAVINQHSLPIVRADPTQLARVFQNLLGNAIKFRDNGKPEIDIGAEHRDREWMFWVRDNGPGIDPQDAERIFMIFQQLQSQSAHGGTGIGLAICKRIVERDGGRIWMESEPGEGSTFYFTIPTESN